MGFAERKQELFEIDAKWNVKFAFRMVMNLICIVSIIMAVMTINKTNTTKFQPSPFMKGSIVLVYIPCDVITIMWNMFNIVRFLVKKKTISHWLNTMMHFLLGFGFAVVGIYVTVVAYGGHTALGAGQVYDTSKGSYMTSNVRGQQVLVTADNTVDCPAFSSCQVQEYWVAGARKRSLISVIGCGLFDFVFVLHCVFFFWCMSDSVFGVRGRKQREMDKEELLRIRKENLEHPIPLSADSDKPFDTSGKTSVTVDEKYNSEFYKRSTRNDIEMATRRLATMPPSSNRNTTASESPSTFRHPSQIPSLVIRSGGDSRESLSLSIFDTAHAPPQRPSSSPLHSSINVNNNNKLIPNHSFSQYGTSHDQETVRASQYNQDLQQQQFQQLQQQVVGQQHQRLQQQKHQHQPGCTCGQSLPRSSLSSLSTFRSQPNRQSSEDGSQRRSMHRQASQPAISMTDRTSSLYSGASGTSSNSASNPNSSNPPAQQNMPPVPTLPHPLVHNTPVARSSLRHSLSASDISSSPPQIPDFSSLGPMSAVQSQIAHYKQQVSQQQRQSHHQNFFDAQNSLSAPYRPMGALQQSIPDMLSPTEEDNVTALPMAPPAASKKVLSKRKSAMRFDM